MHHSRRTGLSFPLVAFALIAGSAVAAYGCKASVTATTGEPAAPTATVAEAPPPADTDGDGITDDQDKCPDKAGKANAEDPSKHGCPEEPKLAMAAPVKHVQIKGDKVDIDEKIMFDTASANIKPESDKLLDEIAAFLKEEGKDIDLIEVAGHADQQGDEKKNLKLTDDRAKSVVEALVKRGVDAKRLRAKGYGEYCPVDTAKGPEADEKNRRVEFEILKKAGAKTNAPQGCEAAAKKGVKPQPVL